MPKGLLLAGLCFALAVNGFAQANQDADNPPENKPPPAPVVTPRDAKEKEDKMFVTTPEEESHPDEMGPTVKEIEVRFAGPRTTNEAIIKANLRTKVGEPFTQSQSDEDVRQLYA